MKKFIVTAAAAALALFVSVSGASAYYTYTGGILTVGSTGTAVMNLQTCLAELGNNPSSNIDGYYGPITANAVMQFQMEHNVENNDNIAVDGIIGPVTGPLYTAACAAEYASDMDMDSDDEDMDEDGDSEFPMFGGEEASLEDFNLQSEDDAEEGELKHVATIDFDVEDGDVMIERLDLTFEFVGDPAGDADNEPWDVFETLVLTVDGEEIAEEDLEDDNDWREEDSPFVFRVTGLDYVVEEGDEAEIEVHLMAQDNVDDAANADWEIYVDVNGIRGVDTAGITQYIPEGADDVEVVTFDVDEEGGDESIEFQSSSDDPDEATLIVDNDENSDWMEIFVFELESDDSDIDIDEIVLALDLGNEPYSDVVNDLQLVIDGEEFDDFDVDDTDSTTPQITFDINDEFTVDADESVDVVLEVEFKDTNDQARYQNGDTIEASTVRVDGEGDDDVFDESTISGNEHTLVAEGLIDSYDSKSAESRELGDDTIAVFTFEFDLEAVEDTFFIAEDGSGFDVQLSNVDTGLISTTIAETDADLTADGSYEINEGSSERFVLEVQVESTDGTQSVRVTIDDIDYHSQSNLGDAATPLVLGAPDYRSTSVTVQGPAA